MNTKKLAGIILIAFVLVTIGFSMYKGSVRPEVEPPRASSAVPTTEAGTETPDTLVVYYFHGNSRCQSCMKIENYTKEAVEQKFQDQLKSGRIQWKVINTDEPANAHFTKDYQLVTKSVIVSEVKGGKQVRWKNLEKVWDYLGNKEEFSSYIQSEINAYMGGS